MRNEERESYYSVARGVPLHAPVARDPPTAPETSFPIRESMPLSIPSDAPTLLIRREAFERAGLTRSALDARLNLTADEFRVEGGIVAIGPLVGDTALDGLIAELEGLGLVYFDDFFELSGNWPAWVRMLVLGA